MTLALGLSAALNAPIEQTGSAYSGCSHGLLPQIEKAEKVLTVRLNRPDKHNAFDELLIAELTQAFRDLASDAAVRVVVLAANGQSFSAGADLDWMKRMSAMGRAENERDAMALANLMEAIDYCPKPVVGVIQGAAFGGGVGLVACCDIAIATSSASFCLSEVRLGLIPAVISPYVAAAIGHAPAGAIS
jgi:methylglutaconyl-CoA hydratase